MGALNFMGSLVLSAAGVEDIEEAVGLAI